MNKLKLLVVSGDFSRFVAPDFHYLMTETAKLTDLILWHTPGSIHDIIASLSFQPDFVLINEFGETNTPLINGLETLSVPYAIYMHDLHYLTDFRKEAMRKLKPRAIFTRYRDKFYEWYPEFLPLMRWLPHHTNTNIFRDYGMPKEIDMLLMGAVHEWIYPLRHHIVRTMENRPGFVYNPHPGYRNIDENGQELVREKYAREINRSKIFFTCDSSYRYPVLKYFEVAACRTLLLASDSNELHDLGFVGGVNFVPIHEWDFEEKANYYLRHEDERQAIAEKGYRLVQERHSTSRRAADLVEHLYHILQQS